MSLLNFWSIRVCCRMPVLALMATTCLLMAGGTTQATPANKAGLEKFFGRFLPARLDACTTCHLPAKGNIVPTSLTDFPHNSFGHRLALAAEELRSKGRKTDIATRLRYIAQEDSDGDGVDNLTEILLGHAPGDPKDHPSAKELAQAPQRRAAFAKFLAEYRWQPFEPVRRPPVPKHSPALTGQNPIDAFLAQARDARHLIPRPPASRAVLLRRVTLDLVGLSPTPEELKAFEADKSPDAYAKVVDRLLASPRYGERWGRHWMDVWRYSDWAGWADGNQIRDSKPFIWRWRDWIVESLNNDKGYDRMVQEMLAADELCPDDPDALRATGFLVRNFKLLSREQWLDDTLNHTSRAFLGLTLGCAKCHNHMYDPITQEEYYKVRAIFEPHNVRTDRVPGQPDTGKDGLVHAFDADPNVPTYLYIRGDERHPDKSHVLTPGVPESLGGVFAVHPIDLPQDAYLPDRRDFVLRETVAAADQEVTTARKALDQAPSSDGKGGPAARTLAERTLVAAQARRAALLAVLQVEKLEATGDKTSAAWKQAATETTARQREAAVQEAALNLEIARRALQTAQAAPPDADGKAKMALTAAQAKVTEQAKAFATAQTALQTPLTTAYQPRALTVYPAQSTGRRLAFARWLTDPQNPLTARVAVNQIWMRHFGTGIVPSVDDFGRNGRPPSDPQLLDWLAEELMDHHWQMKPIHRLIVTSQAYRMASTPDPADARIDPDDVYLWRMPSRRMEAEVVRDNLLYVAGSLDETMGGPEVDHTLGLTSRRRSLYLRTAAEKQVEFLTIFDGPSVTECYARKPSVMPQQALALANSELAINQARILARSLTQRVGADSARFTFEAFLRVLARPPTPQEQKLCAAFLEERTRQPSPAPARASGTAAVSPAADSNDAQNRQQALQRARENLVLVLFNHNDFVTIR